MEFVEKIQPILAIEYGAELNPLEWTEMKFDWYFLTSIR